MDISCAEAGEIIENNEIYEPSYKPIKYCRKSYRLNLHGSFINFLIPGTILFVFLFVLYFLHGYAKVLFFWIENQSQLVIFSLFILFFVIVSFPIAFGYLILLITIGYLFGYLKGLLTVIIGANLGVAIAHNTIGCVHKKIPFYIFSKNDTARAILRVISGPRAFKIVLFTRLTPIPFGVQNTIFGLSTVNSKSYHIATLIGLLPAQIINVYIGSTLRSMYDVFNDNKSALTGYVVFIIQVFIGVGFLFWILQKAKNELSQALITDITESKKLIINIDE